MIFGKSKRKHFDEQIFINLIPLDEETEVKYLGVLIEGKLQFTVSRESKQILREIAQGLQTS